MASYDDIADIISDEAINDRVGVAIRDVLNDILNTDPQVIPDFARSIFENKASFVNDFTEHVLVEQKGLSKSDLINMDDVTMKSTVESIFTKSATAQL